VSCPRVRIEPLGKEHQRSDFDCGNDVVNGYLRQHARQNASKDLCKAYVAVRPGEKAVLGYYAVTAGNIAYEALPFKQTKRLPRYPIPTIHLAWIGVTQEEQGKGLGARLLFHSLRLASRVADDIGAYAVTVRAIDEQAQRFYLAHGFIQIEDDPQHLYLPMSVIRNLPPPE